MAHFNFTIDTQEMAHSIDGISSRMNAVTTAVITTQQAVISAETAAADRVCRHVDEGFFSLIRSQVTQKIAQLRSATDSGLAEMRQQSQALAAIKTRMERDYEMIAHRYARVFRSIDLSLRTRVFELDKLVTSLLHRENERLQMRLNTLQAQVPVHQTESVQLSQAVGALQSKANAQRAIRAIQNLLSGSSRQALLLQSMLFEGAPKEASLRYVPVLLVESDSTALAGLQWDLRMPGGGKMSESVATSVQTTMFNEIPTLSWTPAETQPRERAATEFRRMVEQSSLDERVRSHMLRLFDSSGWQVMAGRRA